MNQTKKIDRTLILTSVALALLGAAILMTTSQAGANAPDSFAGEQWEYLAVAGPSTTNFSPSGNPRMRKEPSAAFGREAFVLQQHLDRLGANGWELVTVAGPPTDPAYYFKRRKTTETTDRQ